MFTLVPRSLIVSSCLFPCFKDLVSVARLREAEKQVN